MATYIVCNSGTTTTRTVANAGFQGSDIIRTYTQGDCNVTETSGILRFNTFTSVDTDYTIWYSNTFTIYIDGVWQSIITQNHTAVVPAGATYVDVEVRKSELWECYGENRIDGIDQQV